MLALSTVKSVLYQQDGHGWMTVSKHKTSVHCSLLQSKSKDSMGNYHDLKGGSVTRSNVNISNTILRGDNNSSHCKGPLIVHLVLHSVKTRPLSENVQLSESNERLESKSLDSSRWLSSKH